MEHSQVCILHVGSTHARLEGGEKLEQKMKNFAKLTLFFSLSFVILFFISILLRYLGSWIDLIRIVPVGALPGGDAVDAGWKVLPAVIYLTILLALSFSARAKIGIPMSIATIIFLGCAFVMGATLGLGRAGALKPALKPVSPLQAAPGLILSRSENAIVLLRESGNIRGPRVVSIPGQPLIYQEVPLGPNNAILNLPDLPFGSDTPWFVRSIGLDCSLSSGEIKSRYESSLFSFSAYVLSLILLLGSLRFLLELSQWPLANIFLGALVFRGILALETFLNSKEINALAGSFLTARVPADLVTPVVFGAIGILVILYTLLSRVASGRRGRHD